MSFGLSAAAIAGIGAATSVGVGLYTANQQANAAEDAANAQIAQGDKGIAEQQRQFDAIKKLLQPFVDAGTGAVTGQEDLVGLNGTDAQQAAINGLQASPQFGALQQQGENAILQNASATGGLRGGNTQAALAQFRPRLLAQLIEQQYGRLGGLTSVGQNAAAGVGNAGMATGNNITTLLGQQGQAMAGNALAQGQANVGLANTIGGGLGILFGGGF